jgi:TRAP-type transport system periplasmic protein
MLNRRDIIGCAAAAPILGMTTGHAQAKTTLKWGNSLPGTHPVNVRAREAAAKITEATGGAIDIQIFPDSQLGSDSDMLSQVRSGALDIYTSAGVVMGVLVPAAGIINVPFAFSTYDKVWPAVDGDLGKQINKQISKVGLYAFDKYWDNGYRMITSATKPVKTVEDLKGFKIRVPASPLNLSLFRSLGAAPISMNLSEVYSALQTRLVDGQENPLVTIHTKGFFEVQKYCSLTNHLWDAFIVVTNMRKWMQLQPKHRDIIETNLNKSALEQRADVAALNNSLQSALESKGMAFINPDIASFKEALRKADFYSQWQKTYGSELWGALTKHAGTLG